MRKSQVVGVGLVSAWLGRREGQGRVSKGLGVPGQGAGFCLADNGEPWITPEHRLDVAQVGLMGVSSGRSSGEALRSPGLGTAGGAWRKGDAYRTLALPPDPWLPPLLAEGLFQPSTAWGRV